MRTRIITNAEIRKILNLGSAEDALVDLWNDAATEILCDILNVSDIASHQVVDERVKVSKDYSIFLHDFPVNTEQSITIKSTYDGQSISGYSFKKDPHSLFTIRSYDVGGLMPMSLPYNELFMTYTAGYQVVDVIELLSNTGLDTKTITMTVTGTTTTYTFIAAGVPTSTQILVGATLNDTASAIAAKFGTSAVGGVITLPLGYSFALGTVDASKFDITEVANVPISFKNVIALIAGGGIAEKNKAGAVVSYSIGGKSVTFRNDSEANAVQTVVNTWLPKFKRVTILAV